MYPPSTLSAAPWMNVALEEARNRTASATSLGVPILPIGATDSAGSSGERSFVIGVAIRPGQTQFTRMLCGVYWGCQWIKLRIGVSWNFRWYREGGGTSIASLFVRLMMAAFEAEYAANDP